MAVFCGQLWSCLSVAPRRSARLCRGVVGLLVAGICCIVLLAPARGAVSRPAPRDALLNARNTLASVQGKASAGAAAALDTATAPALWIDSRDVVTPPYGATVFSQSAIALTDLSGIEPRSAVVNGAIGLVLGADHDLAARVIGQARGGRHSLLAAADRALANGAPRTSAARFAAAARAYQAAWRDAFAALTSVVSRAITSVPSTAADRAAARALGSKRIALVGPKIEHRLAPLVQDGKPEFLFATAEPCPFCAVQRWGTILALSRFGTFSHLSLMQSDTTESPTVQTFTFYGSTYTSRYVSFVPVELLSYIRQGRKFKPLQQLSDSQSKLMKQLNTTNRLPFSDIANQFVNVNSTVHPRLVGSLTWTQLAGSIRRPASIPGQAIAGVAEVITAELCGATQGKPHSVCSDPEVARYKHALPLLDGKGGGCPRRSRAHFVTGVRTQQTPVARSAKCHT